MSTWLIEVADIIGMIGVVLTLVAYFLLQINRLPSDGFIYSFLNVLGAGFVMISLTVNWNMPAFIMEGTWILISLWGVFKALRHKI